MLNNLNEANKYVNVPRGTLTYLFACPIYRIAIAVFGHQACIFLLSELLRAIDETHMLNLSDYTLSIKYSFLSSKMATISSSKRINKIE